MQIYMCIIYIYIYICVARYMRKHIPIHIRIHTIQGLREYWRSVPKAVEQAGGALCGYLEPAWASL